MVGTKRTNSNSAANATKKINNVGSVGMKMTKQKTSKTAHGGSGGTFSSENKMMVKKRLLNGPTRKSAPGASLKKYVK